MNSVPKMLLAICGAVLIGYVAICVYAFRQSETEAFRSIYLLDFASYDVFMSRTLVTLSALGIALIVGLFLLRRICVKWILVLLAVSVLISSYFVYDELMEIRKDLGIARAFRLRLL